MVETLELGGRSMNSRSYCNRFGFKGTDQQKIVGRLSGGERNRVHLAKLLRAGGNLILLTSRPMIQTSIRCGHWRRG